MIPFQNFKKTYARHHKAIDAAVRRVFKRGYFILGPELAAFEEEFARAIHVKYAVGVNSGTDALVLALRALDIGPGDEVITVANTFIATAIAIDAVGATPVFVDINPSTYTMDPDKVERVITKKTKALLPVHLYGHPADMEALMRLARKHKLKVVEDACQAHGATFQKKTVGGIGDVGCFSFYPTKNMGAFGDAGAVVTNNAAIASRVRALRNYGESKKYTSIIRGVNSRLDEIQAALLRWRIKKLAIWDRKRAQIAEQYTKAFKNLPLCAPCVEDAKSKRVWHLYVIRCARRDELKAFLESKGIRTMIHYPVPIYAQPAFSHLKCSADEYPETARATKEILSLPLYPEMTTKEVKSVCRNIREFFNDRNERKTLDGKQQRIKK